MARHVRITQNSKFAISLQHVKKEVSGAVDFYMQISMKACYKLMLRFFHEYGQAFPKFTKKQVCNVFAISLKQLEMKLTFLMQINIKVS